FANTGRHPLAPRIDQIDREYRNLVDACRNLGVQLFNLSPMSRLTALPKASLGDFMASAHTESTGASAALAPSLRRKVFIVNYRFLSCGDIFADGLRHAAAELGVNHEASQWDDSLLPAKVERFAPELILVLHGRRFVEKWGDRFRSYNT